MRRAIFPLVKMTAVTLLLLLATAADFTQVWNQNEDDTQRRRRGWCAGVRDRDTTEQEPLPTLVAATQTPTASATAHTPAKTSRPSKAAKTADTTERPTAIPDTVIADEPTAPATGTSPDRLPTVTCTLGGEEVTCNMKLLVTNNITWLDPPEVDDTGRFTLEAQVRKGHTLVPTSLAAGTRTNVVLTDGGKNLIGNVLPAADKPGVRWKAKPGQWIADAYRYQDRVLTVAADIGPEAATTPGLRVCIWRGGMTREETYPLGCTSVRQP